MEQKLLTIALVSSALGTGQNALAQTRGTTTDKPNVIIILADDLGYGDLECYGAKNVQTPNINKLAHSGIRFTNGHAVAATSTPSRYSLLTGEYAWRREGTDVAAGNAGMIIKPSQFTMADMFKSRGYATCAIGKWHLGLGDKGGEQDWNAPLSESLGDLGFDYHYIMAATADRVPCVFIENGLVANYDPAHPIEVSYVRNFEGEPTGRKNPELLYNMRSSHGHDMSIVNGIGRIGYMKGGGKALWKDENLADSILTHAIKFVENHKKEPFFMYFATNDIHVPRFPHERFRGKSLMGVRGDAIVQFDWTVGQLMKKLHELKIDDNTLIILTSDNGPVVDDGYQDGAEELLNGHSPKALVSQIDLLSSLGSLVHARFPKGSAPDSRDYLPTLLGKDKKGRNYVIGQSNTHVLSVLTAQYRYIEPSNGPKMIQWGPKIETGNLPVPQLYDMTVSPFESKNIAAEHPDEVFRMQLILKDERNK